jgi:hypothetical protein
MTWVGSPARPPHCGTPAPPLNQNAADAADVDVPLWVHEYPAADGEVAGGNAAQPLAVGGFASGHVHGLNFAFGDGSIRFITDDVLSSLMARLANRADGQMIDAKEF